MDSSAGSNEPVRRARVPRLLLGYVLVCGIGLLALARTQQYYGHIYNGWDAQFYYSLAHSFVFDRDLDITNNLNLTPWAEPFDLDRNGSFEAAPRRPDGRIPSKYPVGLSIIEAPFLAAGRVVRWGAASVGLQMSGAPGYSMIEIWSVALGLLAVFCAALIALYRFLADEYGERPAVIGVACCWLGTSLFHYSAIFPFMAHAASFASLVAIMGAAKMLGVRDRTNHALALLGAALAATFLIRPQQMLLAVCLAPLVLATLRQRRLAEWLPGGLVAVAMCVLAVLTQLLVTESQFGRFNLSGYAIGGEGFNWWHPKLAFVLLDPSRGLLVFSPVVILAAIGFVRYRGSVPAYFWPQVVNAMAQVYLVAAWSSPDQGDSFGARMLSDNAAVVAIGVAVLMARAPLRARWVATTCAVVAMSWTNLLLLRYLT